MGAAAVEGVDTLEPDTLPVLAGYTPVPDSVAHTARSLAGSKSMHMAGRSEGADKAVKVQLQAVEADDLRARSVELQLRIHSLHRGS